MEINVLEAKGLQTDPNPLSSVEKGALVSCTNLSCDRVNVYEKTRGYSTYTTLSGLVKKYLYFQGKTLAYYLKNGTTQTLAYDNGTGFTDYGALPSSYPIFATSANSNFYVTSDSGIKKLDSVTGALTSAGVPQGLGGSYTLITATGNVIANNQKAAYRIVWGYVDANNNLVLGAPSPRIPILNTSGATKDVQLVIQIPDDITLTTYFYQVYRANPVVNTTEPLDEMYMVNQITLTSADIVNGYVTFEDHVASTDTGATIYTAPSQQGIQNSYFQPPFAKDIGTFEGTNFYANTKTKQVILLQLNKVQSTGFGYFTVTGDTVSGQNVIINVSSTASVQIGQIITNPNIPASTVVTGKTLTTITILNAATATATGTTLTLRDYVLVGSEYYYASDANDTVNNYFNVNTDLESATINLVNLINTNSPSYNSYYLGIGNTDKGVFEIEARTFAQSAFTVSSSQGTAFVTNLPQTSQNEVGGNRLYLSIQGQPEAVPFGNWVEVGTAEFYIERILFLRDSYYIFKSDGSLFKGVGSTIDSISIRLYNSNAKLRGIQLPAILDNNIFAFSDQGVDIINDNGVETISYPIERDLFKLSKTRNSSFADVSFGIGYESDRKYIMFVNTLTTDTVATQAYVYNILTKAWTRWQRDASYGFWNKAEDRLYMGTTIVKKERKNYDVTDFCEGEVSVTVNTVVGKVITVVSSAGISVGWSLYQNGIKSKITAINGNSLTVSQSLAFIVGAATAYEPMLFNFTYVPQTYGELAKNKANKELTHYVENVTFESITQTINNEDQSNPDTDDIVPKSSALPLQYIRSYIPKNQTRSNWLNITVSQSEACTNVEYLGYTLTGEVVSERNK